MKWLKIAIVLFAIWFISSIVIVYYFTNEGNEEAQNVDDTVHPNSGEGTNTLGIGLFDLEGDIIDSGSMITDDNGYLEYTVSFDSFIDSEREYALVALVDLEQVPFTVDGESYDKYFFNMDTNSTIDIDTIMAVDESNSEVSYLIFKEPNTYFKPQEIDYDVMAEATSLENIISLRFPLGGEEEKIIYSEGYEKINNGQPTNIFLSETIEELAPVFEKEQGEELKISVGNTFSNPMEVAIVQFLDFEQIPFDDGEMVHFINMDTEELYVSDITLPKVDEDTNYQVAVVHSPLSPTREDFDSLFLFGSYRLVITP